MIKKIKEDYDSIYKKQPQVIVRAPGRVNIIGEHTDYNYGYAMPAAINKYICISISKNNTNIIRAYSSALDESFLSSDVNIEKKHWTRYVLGVCDEMDKRYNLSSGYDITIHSSLDMCKGISSSAALEISIVKAIASAFKIVQTDEQIIDLCRLVDHKHVGINSGTLDFSASENCTSGP